MTTRGVGIFLAGLAAGALALNGYHWLANGRLSPMMLLPAAGLIIMLAALPFLSGWNPFASSAERLSSCAACGTMWSPRLDGTPFCPACGGKTAQRAA